jgi:two-component system, sensor histidine kinase PdtaS
MDRNGAEQGDAAESTPLTRSDRQTPALDGAVSEGAVSEGAVSEGAVSEGAVSEGAVSEGAVSEGAVSEGAAVEDLRRLASMPVGSTPGADSQELFRQALEASPTGMLMVDERGIIVLVNAQIERLFGYSRRELIGQPVEMLVPLRYAVNHPEFRATFLKGPRARPMGAGRDLYGRCKDGAEIAVEIGLNPMTTKEGRFVLSSVVDITARKRAEDELAAQRDDLDRKNREREVLLKEVYHRVKNNLQVISSLLNLQSDQVKDTGARKLLEEACNRVDSIALVHEQLYQSTDLARINFSVYLQDLVEHLKVLFQPGQDVQVETILETVHLSVDVAIPCGLLVNELLTNALLHAFEPGQSGKVYVELHRTPEGEVRLGVSDTGRGLPPHLDVATANTLGLELVGKLAKQIRGKLKVESNHGTSFDLRFNCDA